MGSDCGIQITAAAVPVALTTPRRDMLTGNDFHYTQITTIVPRIGHQYPPRRVWTMLHRPGGGRRLRGLDLVTDGIRLPYPLCCVKCCLNAVIWPSWRNRHDDPGEPGKAL